MERRYDTGRSNVLEWALHVIFDATAYFATLSFYSHRLQAQRQKNARYCQLEHLSNSTS